MKVTKIYEILDLAKAAKENDLVFNPCFVGDAGLGKSQCVQQWVAKQRSKNPKFGFIDLRLAYFEAPDIRGFPEVVDVNGRHRTISALPDFWPTDGESEGLLVLEEINRATTSVTNTMMQLLTDGRIGDYDFPKRWIICAAINPDNAKYDVNAMDQALADRFQHFEVDYDYNVFLDYIETHKWHKNVVNFIKAGQWVYKSPDSIGKEGKYISPRTWAAMDAAERSGASQSDARRATHRIIAQSILGKHIGNEYWKSCWDDAPVLASDLINNFEKSLKKLKEQSKQGVYAGDKITVTVESIIENYGGWFKDCKDQKDPDKVDEETMVSVAEVIPSDQAINLIKGCGFKVYKGQITSWFSEFNKRNPKCVEIMKDNIKLSRAVKQ